MSLPIITFPNDTNESDVSVLTENGKIESASYVIKNNTIVKDLVSKKIKLMADNEEASPSSPQVRVVRLNTQVYVSISFFCSKDNYGRKTSSSLIFELSDKPKLLNMLEFSELPQTIVDVREELRDFIKNFDLKEYELKQPITVKKKLY